MKKQLAHPVTAAILALIAPIAGAWLAVRKDQILLGLNQALPAIQKPIWCGIGDLAIFATLFMILLVGFTLHKKAESEITKERHSQLGGAVSALNDEVELVSTIGLRRIGKAFQEAIVESYPSSYIMLVPNATQDQISAGIKSIVAQIVAFSKELDLSPTEASYSASVFLYWSREELEKLSHSDWNDVRKQIEFKKNISCNLEDISGLLRLYHEFPFSREMKGKQGGDRLTLPVHVADAQVSTAHKVRLLPGAPYAVSKKKSIIIRSLHELEHWCSERADYSHAAQREILDFFITRPIRSFVAIPLCKEHKKDSQVIGVICIERSSEGIFQGHRFETVDPLLSPLLIPLTNLLNLYMEKVSARN